MVEDCMGALGLAVPLSPVIASTAPVQYTQFFFFVEIFVTSNPCKQLTESEERRSRSSSFRGGSFPPVLLPGHAMGLVDK